jgi:serine/threonine protein kinase
MLGTTLGNYRIERQLGAGGMGVVYEGTHVLLGRTAAVKVLLAKYSQDDSIVQRFFNEARAATAIKHPGIVEIYDFGHAPEGAYIVMELCDGESLATRIRRRRTMPVVAAVTIVRHIAGTLAVAHAAGIIHRDLKPDNVFVVRDPDIEGGERIKLLDFGIAKLATETAGPSQTTTGVIMGTPNYMSPEQCRGAGQIDHRSDLYAIGCILFELLCGRVPFVGEGSGDIIGAHLLTPPPQPSSLMPAIPAELEALVLRLLAKKPAERPESASALAAELQRLAAAIPDSLMTRGGDIAVASTERSDPPIDPAGATTPSPPPPDATVATTAPTPPPPALVTPPSRPASSRGRRLVGRVFGIATVVVLLGGIAVVMNNKDTENGSSGGGGKINADSGRHGGPDGRDAGLLRPPDDELRRVIVIGELRGDGLSDPMRAKLVPAVVEMLRRLAPDIAIVERSGDLRRADRAVVLDGTLIALVVVGRGTLTCKLQLDLVAFPDRKPIEAVATEADATTQSNALDDLDALGARCLEQAAEHGLSTRIVPQARRWFGLKPRN